MAPSVAEIEHVVSEPLYNTTSQQINGTKTMGTLELQEDEKHDFVLRVYRCLIADLCEQFKGGHPGYV
jgi:dihydroxyacetone synthase